MLNPSAPDPAHPGAMNVTSVREMSQNTPATRNRVVDLLRALSIVVVVLGHWMMASLVNPDGSIDPHGLLERAPWTQWLTWVFQVMPIFFLVGGYSNALSWRSTRAKGGDYATWLRARIRRLMTPVVPLLIFWVVAVSVLTAVGVPADTLRPASQAALVPTWFLAAYVLVVAVAPFTLWLWERWGWASVVGGIVLAAVIDAVSIAAGNKFLGYPNYLVVWATVHTLGYAWLDGKLAGSRRRLLLAVAGFAALVAAVYFGPYPASMIGLDSNAVNNSAPTRITMMFLGFVQAGILLSLEQPLARWLQRPGPWMATIFVNARIMTLYLWHLTMFMVIVGSCVALGGFGLGQEPLSGAWWATRPLWILVLLAATWLAILVFGRFENPVKDSRPAPPVWLPVLATVLCCGGLAVMATVGVVGRDGVAWWWPMLPVLGVASVALGGRPRPAPPAEPVRQDTTLPS